MNESSKLKDLSNLGTPATKTTSTSGDNNIISAPDTGKKIKIKFIQATNNTDTDEVTVKFSFDGGSTYHFLSRLARAGGMFERNLVGCNILCDENTAPIINLSDAIQISTTIIYETVNILQ